MDPPRRTVAPDLVRRHALIDDVLARFSDELGTEALLYRNHVYRGLNLHLRLTGPEISPDLTLAWATHDLGLWTAGTLDYLAPSADLAEQLAPEFGVADPARLRLVIESHHCMRPVADPLAEGFRSADRADAWPTRWRGALTKEDIAELVGVFPYCGFHRFLGRRALRYAVVHPWRPLPMFRWRPPPVPPR